MSRTLSREEARSFYDRFGAKQDAQAFYEDRATRDLVAHAEFGKARAVLEFGCGTGRFAEQLLADHLPPDARYLGVDLSSTMVELSRRRLARFGERARVELTDGAPRVAVPDGSFDRFVSNYVLDLLPEQEIRAVVAEAHRVLREEGRLCLVGLTHGRSLPSRALVWAWERIHALRPRWVGGCRPVELLDFVAEPHWRVEHANAISAFGVPSEVLVAAKASD